MNEVTFTGRLTRDPELRFTPSGVAVASFGLAVNRKYRDRNGAEQEKVVFYDVSAWRELGENIAESLSKGDLVMVTGYHEPEEWTDREGNKRVSQRITANDVAPSLRFAKTQISRVSSGGGSRQAGAEAHAADAGHFGVPVGVGASDDQPF